MTIPFACVVLAFSMMYLTKLPVAVAMARLPKGYNNRTPRDQQAQLTGWGKRALGAHQNSFESFPAFAAAVIVAHLGGADPDLSAALAVTHVLARVAYTAAYIADVHLVRSLIWTLSTLCSFGLFILPWVNG